MVGFESTLSKRFDLLTDVNACGAYTTIHAALPYFRGGDHAYVVIFPPPVPVRPVPGKVAYAFSKYGMTSITQSLVGESGTDDVGADAL